MYDVMIIAGYDVFADKIPSHRAYVIKCWERAKQEKISMIVVVGGATNPDFPELTEAEANKKILMPLLGKDFSPILVNLWRGKTSAETLRATLDFFREHKVVINKLTLCAEQARLANFLADALQIGLIDPARELIAYGFHFPESVEEFPRQREKMLINVLSHHGWLFRCIRNIRQKSHQKKVSRQKRREAKK
jgi:hypothetical protein